MTNFEFQYKHTDKYYCFLYNFLNEQYEITEVGKVNSGHIRQYLDHLGKRGKYTVVVDDINMPKNRNDYAKPLSSTII